MSFALGRCFFRIGLDVYVYVYVYNDVYVYNVVDTRFVCPLAKPIVVLNSFFMHLLSVVNNFFSVFSPSVGV